MTKDSESKSFLERWKDFWFWFDGFEMFLVFTGLGILNMSIVGGLALLRGVGLI